MQIFNKDSRTADGLTVGVHARLSNGQVIWTCAVSGPNEKSWAEGAVPVPPKIKDKEWVAHEISETVDGVTSTRVEVDNTPPSAELREFADNLIKLAVEKCTKKVRAALGVK